jgi:hypothetical protein
VPERLFDEPDEFIEWAQAALAAADRERARPPPCKKSRPIRTAIMSCAPAVVAFRDDFGKAVIDRKFHLDVGIKRQQLCQPQDGFGGMLGDPDGPCGVFPKAGFSRSSVSADSSESICSKLGPVPGLPHWINAEPRGRYLPRWEQFATLVRDRR